jgi:hypothetical protein
MPSTSSLRLRVSASTRLPSITVEDCTTRPGNDSAQPSKTV